MRSRAGVLRAAGPFVRGGMGLDGRGQGAGIMIGFWVAAATMVAMVALVLITALRQGRREVGGGEDLGVYRDQLAEVARDMARGTLPEAEADRLRLEVQRRMLDADRAAQRVGPVRAAWFGPGVVVIGLALAASFAFYWWLGVPGYPDVPLSDRLAMAEVAYRTRPTQAEAEARQPAYVVPEAADPAFLAQMQQLRAAVKTRPDDIKGHLVLASSEADLGNFRAAYAAQQVVIGLEGDAATSADYARLAGLMAFAAGGIITPEAEAALKNALVRDPANSWARFYSGLMFAQIGRPDQTFNLWQPLMAEGPPDAAWIAPIRAQISDVAAAAGVNYVPPAVKGPDAAQVAAAGEISAADRQTMIEGMVGGLEARLMKDGGAVEDWGKLLSSLAVLKQADRATAAYAKAVADYAGHPGELAALQAAAAQAGIAP